MISLLPFPKGDDKGEAFPSPQVGPTEHPFFRLFTLVLSSIEEERRHSPQARLHTHQAGSLSAGQAAARFPVLLRANSN
jgi:hypothetical protein